MTDNAMRFLRALSAPAAEAGWKPIESAPKDGTSVLIVAERGKKRVVGEAYYFTEEDGDLGDDGWWWANTGPGDYEANKVSQTHRVILWRPLPAAPPPRR